MKTVGIRLLLLQLSVAFAAAGEQSVRITGRLTCRNRPEQFAEVQLINYHVLLSNDVMARDVFTDPSGYFEISGYISQWLKIAPRLYIWHRCWEKAYENEDPCWRKLDIQVPDIHIQSGVLADKAWDMGELPLDKATGHSVDAC